MLPNKMQIPEEFSALLENNDWREAAVYGGRYSLKSHTVARVLLIIASQRKIRVGCFREFQNSISDSSWQLFSDLIEQYHLVDFKMTQNSIVNIKTNSDFIFRGLRNNAQSVKSIEGIDYAWVEEAQTITEPSIEILVPTVRKKGSKIIWTYNRLNELDPIHKRLVIEGRPNTLVINANYDVALKYGWLIKEILDEIDFDRDENPELYQHKWLGQPIEQSDNAAIGRTSIMNAMNRKVDDIGGWEMGVDVARMGNDRTVIVLRKGFKTIDHKVYTHLRTTEVVDMIEQMIVKHAIEKNQIIVKIDETGVGAGVVDETAKRGYPTAGVNNGGLPHNPNKYPNVISEAWFHLKDIMDEIELPNNTDLMMELSTRFWKVDSKSRRLIESKDDYKKRGWRSPDLADAFILAYYNAGAVISPRSDKERQQATDTLITNGLRSRSF